MSVRLSNSTSIDEPSPRPLSLLHDTNLTAAQTAMWTAQAMYPGVPVATIATSVRISGALDVGAFVEAFRRLVASTDALRMVIREQDGVPVQVENAVCDSSVDLVDIAGATDEEIDSWLRRRCSRPPDVRTRSFDTVLLTLGPSDHLWFLHLHHLFGDGWSGMMIRDRLSRFYLREIGRPVEIAERFPRWQDLAANVYAYQASADGAADRQQLARLVTEDVEPVEFFGIPRRKHTTVISRQRFSLDRTRTLALQARAAEASNAGWDAANFYLIGAALAAYLHRLTGRRTVSFGAPYHNRRPRGDRQTAAMLKRTCGLLMDVLPVVVEVDHHDSFQRLIEKLSAVWAVAARHAAGGTPPEVRRRACDVLLNYLPPMPEQLFGTSTRITWVHPGHEIESLSIQVREYQEPECLEFMFDFHSDVFPDDARPVIMRQFRRLLDACVDDPSRPVGDVDLLTTAERHQVIEQWNQTLVPATTDRTVVDSFEEQVAARGRAIAVEDDVEAVTYEDLHDRSSRVGEALAARGARSETLVGLCIPRSSAQIAALLGILRAGAAYLPLDPVLPDERLETVLADAGVSLVVTSASLGGRKPLHARAPVIVEDLLGATDSSSSEKRARPPFNDLANSSPGGSPASLAYVIYTSGSTGMPKGVEITRAALSNFASFARAHFHVTPHDRVLQFASLSFDTAAEEIFAALTAGATLVLRNDRMLDSVDEFLDSCAERAITVLDLPTAYWHTIIDVAALRRSFPPTVRAVILGGEAVRPDMLARWRDWVGTRIALFNGYGPTETTVCASYADLTSAVEPAQGPVSIGRPVWNARTYLLDVSGQPVAPGFAGELHVGGVGVARGYRNAAALTAARFVPNPWQPGERLYRTGDRARWRSTGELEYLGRLDDQVKVRGYRVEPGEIEARLQAHPAVREATVVARAVDADTRLVAYVGAGDQVTAADLRDFLAARLPAYMVPSAFVLLDRLPRTLSGKVDRRALPAPALEENDASRAPRTRAERAIARIWSELLGLPAVGIDQNFFDLGGHSLLGTRVVARVANALGVSVPLWLLFEHPTVAGLAAALKNADGPAAVPARPLAAGAARRGARTLRRARRTPAE